jgi:hypothetical protein
VVADRSVYWLYAEDAARWTGSTSRAQLVAGEIFAEAAAALVAKASNIQETRRESVEIEGQPDNDDVAKLRQRRTGLVSAARLRSGAMAGTR